MLKKLTFLTLLTTPAIAANTPLTITPTELENGTAYLSWNENLNILTSYTLSFTLHFEPQAEDAIFSTYYNKYYHEYGVSLFLTTNGNLELRYNELKADSKTILSHTQTLTAQEDHDITFTFISLKDNTSSKILSLTINGETQIAKIDNNSSAIYESAILNKDQGHIVSSPIARLSDISLTIPDIPTIPEPTTATLSIVGLSSFLIRRRRK
ncbi:MAG: hypothetical protein E7033_05965 [Akkermansiaceae bacterium]|nr:hypothetical protein [Akkermansiaceae bacterium]